MTTNQAIHSPGNAAASFRLTRQASPAGRLLGCGGLLLLAVLPGPLTPAAQALEAYTFESLAANTFIAGLDGWQDQPGQGQAVIALDASGNGTKVVRHHKTVVFDQSAFITRTNNASFNFVSFLGTETNAVIQFEATGEHVAMFALGRDLNGDGVLSAAAGELGPAFGAFDRKFRIQEANLGIAYEGDFNEGGGDGNSGNDWYRIQLRLDFTAGGGEGTGTLAAMNLSDGHTFFETSSSLRNRPLGLTRLHPDARPAKWNALWLHLLSNGNSVPSADNLVPNLNGIRITEVVHVGPDVVLHWRGGVGPYQVQRRAGLDAGNWENVGATTTLMTATAAIAGDTGFFRVVQP
jgi:hypothetical protein